MSDPSLPLYTVSELRAMLRKKDPPICTLCDNHPACDVHHRNGNHADNAPTNIVPVCKRCHNELHDISDDLFALRILYRQYSRLQRQRIGVGNQIRAYAALGYTLPASQKHHDALKAQEGDMLKDLKSMLKLETVYTAYLSHIMGVGPALSAGIISEIADPGRFATVSALWAYLGLDVRDGKAPRRKRGENANWNHAGRSIVTKRLTDQFARLKHHPNCLGRTLYDRYKSFYTERDGETLSLGHIDNRARRKVAKVFLACLWSAWRQLKGLPVTKPYAMARLGHQALITPEDWAGADWLVAVQEPLGAVKEHLELEYQDADPGGQILR